MNDTLREQAEVLDLAHVFIRDMDSRITFWNTGDARMYGYTPQEAVGRVSHELLETIFPVPLEDIEAALAKSGEWEGELTQTRRDGQQIVVASYWVLHKDEHGSPASIVEVNNDITESKLAEESLEESNRRLQVLSETASQLLVTDDPQGLVQSLCETVMQFLGCHAFFNYLVDEERDCLHLNACYGIPSDVAKSIEWLDYGVAVCGCAARDACRIVAEDIPNTPDPRTELVKSFGIRAYACHPLLSAGGRVIGTLSFGSKTKTCFTDDELDLMKTVADQVAVAMERIRAERQLEARALELQEINQDLETTTEELRCESEERRASEEALIQSERRYRELVQDANSAIIRWDRNGTITFFNEYAQQVFGYSEDEIIGRNVNILVPQRESSGEDLSGLVQDILGDPDRYRNNINENIRSDGSRFWMMWTNRPILDENGRVAQVLAVGSDITERKRSEAELEKQRGLLQAVINNIPDQINLIRGSDLRIVLVNPAYQAIAPGKEMVGKTLDEVWPELDRDFVALCRRVLETGEPYHAVDDPVDISRYPGGPTERRYFTWMLLPIDLPGDGGKGILNMSVETTDRVKAEEALRYSEARLRRLYESGMIGVIYYNLDGAITDANDKFLEMVGYTREDMEAGRIDWTAMTPPEYAEADAYAVWELKTKGVDTPYEKEYIRKDGSRVPIIIGAATLGGEKYEGISFVLDITERKKAEQEQEHLSQELQLALNAAKLGWWHYDPETQITTYDERYRQILGLGGGPLPIGDILAHVHPEDAPHILEAGQAAVDPVNPKPYSDEYRIFRGNGSMRWVEVHGMGIFEGQGNDRHAVGFVGTVQDITERKKAEEAVKESEERYRTLFSRMNEGFALCEMIFDENGRPYDFRYLNVNPAFEANSGLRPDQVVGKTARELFPSIEPYWIETYGRVVETGEPTVIENYLRDLDRYFDVSVFRPAPGRFAALFSDVTDRKKAEEAVRRAEESKVEFYRRSISAATDGKFEITDRSVIEAIAGPALASWKIDEPADLATVRHGVEHEASAAGMDRSVIGRFVLAAGEAATNAIKHAGGGTASLHQSGDSLLFMITDKGPGIMALNLPEVALRTRYSTAGTLGVGYKVMMKVADRVYLATGPEGTVVGIRMSLHPAESPAPAVPAGV